MVGKQAKKKLERIGVVLILTGLQVLPKGFSEKVGVSVADSPGIRDFVWARLEAGLKRLESRGDRV